MIWNVIDRRMRKYRWAKIHAIIEPTRFDNALRDADQAPEIEATTSVVYDERNGIALHEAIDWANTQGCPVTLYLYDGWSTAKTRQS